MAGSNDENPPPQTPTQQAPHTVSTIKLPIMKKGVYDIWAMKMEHYLSHTDYPIWEFIQKGNGPVSVLTDTNGVIKVLPPKIVEEILARERERKARTTLLMALPKDHLGKFHEMNDAKDMWDAIKSRFGDGLHKGYDRFQSLLSQLEIHGAGVSTEDANQKFLRSLPSSWSQVSLVMRTKPGVDSLSFDDLYNNLRVFESDVKGSTGSSSSAQNVAFVSSESTSSTNDVSTAYGVSTSSGYNSQRENSSSYTDELMYSFFANQSSGPHLDHEDLEQLDKFDLKEMDLKCQVAMISMRLKKFYKKTEGVDWTGHAEDEQENFALIAYSDSGSDTKVKYCSKECMESYAKLKKLYDEQREQLGDASIEIQAYTQALKKVEAQLVTHQKNQLWYEEKIIFIKIDLDDKTDVLTYHKKLFAEAVKEMKELKTKLENFQSSFKGLSKLLNSQMSTRDKFGLGYGDQVHNGVLSYENEDFQSVFDRRSSDVEDSPVHDRFANVEGMHAVPPPMTGNYMPSGPDREVDDSMFTYGPKQSKTSESDTQTSNYDSCESNSSTETLKSVHEPVIVEPKVVSQPNVWYDAPIIKEYESDSDAEYVIQLSKEQEKPSFAFVNTVKHVKTPRETIKEQNTYSPSLKANKRDWNGLMSKRWVWDMGLLKRQCFIYGSFSHLIKDCDFHEKKMAKQVEMNKKKGKGTGQWENRSVWNNVQRLNHQNKFAPTAVLTRTSRIPVNTARQNLSSQAGTTSTARKVNTARPILNEIRPRNNLYKSHSPIRRPLINSSTKTKFQIKKLILLRDIIEFCGLKEIKREYSNARTSQQNGVAKRKNMIIIEAARTMLADSFLPNTFWAEAVNTPVRSENQANKIAGPKEANHNVGTKDNIDAGISKKEADPAQDYFVLPIYSSYTSTDKSSEAKNEGEKHTKDTGLKTNEEPIDQEDQTFLEELERLKRQEKEANDAFEVLRKEFAQSTKDLLLQAGAARATSTNTINTVSTPLSTTNPLNVFSTVADFTNLESIINVSPIPTSRIHSIHPTTQILRDPKSAVQTRSKVNKSSGAYAFISYIQKQIQNNHKDFQHCLFACFLSQIEPKKISEALKDESWVDAMQEELLHSTIPQGLKPLDQLCAYYYMGFIVYQMDVKSAFLYSTIDKEVYVSQPLGFVDPKFPKKVYKVVKALYGLSTELPEPDKYVVEILKKFDFASVKTASTPIETQKPLTKDEEAADVDVHLYRSMIGSLMYLTASRPDIMFAVYACSRFQVTPKTSHLNDVKRIFRYLKGKPKLGLWYPRVSSFDLEAYSNSDYARVNLDKKSTTGGAEDSPDDNVTDLLTKAFDVSSLPIVNDEKQISSYYVDAKQYRNRSINQKSPLAVMMLKNLLA
ncbi:ribonuclease H-like domain-containing protein [Tanacetum coccineum]